MIMNIVCYSEVNVYFYEKFIAHETCYKKIGVH